MARMLSLEGQVALVTGSSGGIGRGVALELARRGADVAINYHSDEKGGEEVAEEIRKLGRRAIAEHADVSKEGDVERVFARTVETLGTVDIAVVNAGIEEKFPFEKTPLESFHKVIEVNLTGAFLTCRAAIREFDRRGMRKSARALGKIICVSSVHEVIPWAGYASYTASKGGLMLMMKTIAQEVASRKIRVNSVAPGAIRTDINRDAWETPEAMSKLLKMIPAGRIGEVDDVARAVAWLSSDESDYVTGTTLFVDGGMTLYPEFRFGG